MGFRSLQHIRNRWSTSHGLYLPATFRLQGLFTLLTASSLRFPAGFISHRRRSWDSPFGACSSRKVSPPFDAMMNPHAVFPAFISPVVWPQGRSRGPQLLGFDPNGNPWRKACFLIRHSLDAPLGLPLRGFTCGSLERDFAHSPLIRF